MHAEALYQLACQRHADDIAHASRWRLARLATRRVERDQEPALQAQPRPRFA